MKMCDTKVYVTGEGLQGTLPRFETLEAAPAVASVSPWVYALGALLIFLIVDKKQ